MQFPAASKYVSDISRLKANLQVLWTELVAIHVDGRQEDGLHLVVPQFV